MQRVLQRLPEGRRYNAAGNNSELPKTGVECR